MIGREHAQIILAADAGLGQPQEKRRPRSVEADRGARRFDRRVFVRGGRRGATSLGVGLTVSARQVGEQVGVATSGVL